MRTTIQLDDQLLAEAKQRVAQTGRTLKAMIEDALREAPLAHRLMLHYEARKSGH